MHVDDGQWASKLALKDKTQQTASDFIAVIKAAHLDSEIPESLTETARQFATLEGTMKNTRQNVSKLNQLLRQVQDVNFTLLDNLRATDQACENLQLNAPFTPSRD